MKCLSETSPLVVIFHLLLSIEFCLYPHLLCNKMQLTHRFFTTWRGSCNSSVKVATQMFYRYNHDFIDRFAAFFQYNHYISTFSWISSWNSYERKLYYCSAFFPQSKKKIYYCKHNRSSFLNINIGDCIHGDTMTVISFILKLHYRALVNSLIIKC